MNANTGALRHGIATLMRLAGTVCLILLLLAPFHAAKAEVTARDLQIAARVLGFLDPPYTGRVRMGLVYDTASTRSSQQAAELQRLLGNGMTVGNLQLQAVLVPLSDTARADVDFFFLIEGSLSAEGASISIEGSSESSLSGVLAARKLPCLTTELAQVRAGICTIGIQSAPKVEILVNRAAATATNTRFASVFRMMVVEL